MANSGKAAQGGKIDPKDAAILRSRLASGAIKRVDHGSASEKYAGTLRHADDDTHSWSGHKAGSKGQANNANRIKYRMVASHDGKPPKLKKSLEELSAKTLTRYVRRADKDVEDTGDKAIAAMDSGDIKTAKKLDARQDKRQKYAFKAAKQIKKIRAAKTIGEGGLTDGIVGSIINKNYNGVNESINTIMDDKITNRLNEISKKLARNYFNKANDEILNLRMKHNSKLYGGQGKPLTDKVRLKHKNREIGSERASKRMMEQEETTTSDQINKFRKTHNLSSTPHKGDAIGQTASAKVGQDISKAVLAAGGGTKTANLKEMTRAAYQKYAKKAKIVSKKEAHDGNNYRKEMNRKEFISKAVKKIKGKK
jgi:hypothetical protein